MKIFFLFLITITLAFSSDKKIILGSYVQEINASNRLTEVQKIIQEDKVLHKLIDINNLTVQVEQIGQYHAVSVATLTSYVQLLRTMKALRKYYADLYVLPPYESTSATTVATSADKEVQVVPAEVVPKVIKKTQEVKTVPVQKIQEVAKTVKVTQDTQKPKDDIEKKSIPEVTTIQEEPEVAKKTTEPLSLPVFKDLEEPAEPRTLFTVSIIFTIIIGVILLIILLGILFTMTRSIKEDKNKYNF